LKKAGQSLRNDRSSEHINIEGGSVNSSIPKLWLVGLVAIIVLTFSAMPAVAHHSFAMYDQSVTKTMTGKLTRYIPGANHVQMFFDVIDNDGKPIMKDGKPVQWGVEMGSAAQMARQGVTPKSFPDGTIFTVTVYPLRDGRNMGAIAGNLIKCGNTMPKGGCTKETGQVLVGRNFNAQ
jgi:hypothetical protein